MERYKVTLTGKTPLIQHNDNIDWSDRMKEWDLIPENNKERVRGDDRSPAFRWLGSLYHDGAVVTVPSDNLMRTFMEGGAMMLVPGGGGKKTFKSQTQSGAMVAEPHWPLLVNGKTVDVKPLLAMAGGDDDFNAHQRLANELGFVLFVKRAKIGQSKHVRVRPRFDDWVAEGTINVWDKQLTHEVLQQIWSFSGQYKGLCDWRPGGKTPGPWGTFDAKVEKIAA